MTSKFPITKPIHPKFIIQHIVASAVRGLYGVSWDPRVVRQVNRNVESKSLKHIDYAVPCFELARDINMEVSKLTGELAKYLSDHVSKDSSSEYFKYFAFDAVGGYLNIELNKSFIEIAAENSKHWTQNPQLLGQANPVKIFALGYADTFGDNTNCHNVIDILSKLEDALEIPLEIRYLFSDTSEVILPKLAEKIATDNLNASTINPRMQMQVKREIKGIIAGQGSHNTDIQISKGYLFENILPQSADYLHGLVNSKAVTVACESVLITEVQKFIDQTIKKSPLGKNIVYDHDNLAAYYSNGDTIIPLRSFEGYLYNDAFLLHEIYNQFKSVDKHTKLAIICPVSKHSTILEYLSSLEFDHSSVVFFDPKVSKLDVIEFKDVINSIEGFLKSINLHIGSLKARASGSEFRQQLLLLIDFPMDITNSISQLQLPALFDLLNQVAKITEDSNQ